MSEENTNKYFLELPHEEKDCAEAIKLVHIRGYIEAFDWGCADGEHTAVMILEAANEEEVINILPPLLRPKARVVKLNKYSPEDVEALHADN